MGDARIPDRRHPSRQRPQPATNPMRQPTRGRGSPPPLSLQCTSDELDVAKFSYAAVRFVARIRPGSTPQEAQACFAPAAAEFVRGLEGDDDDGRMTVKRAFFSQRTQTVTQPFVCTPEESDRLRRATDSNGWVDLPRWGQAAVFFGDGPALREFSVFDMPVGVEHEFLGALLLQQANIEVLETVSVQDELTGLPRADAARLLVTADTCLPSSIILQLPDGNVHTIQVRAISALPPAPGEQAPRATYADAAAGHGPPPAPVPAGAAWGRAAPAPSAAAAAAGGPAGAGAGTGLRLVGRPARQPSPPSGSGSSQWRGRPAGAAAAAAAGGASPRQRSPAGGGAAAAAAAAAGRASPRSHSPPAARQAPPARTAPGQPGGRQDSPSGSTAGSRPASPTAQAAAKRLRIANPFATLTDQDNMDADPGTLLAPQLPADPIAPDAASA